ncbi:hypothetical protein COJ96_01970 [Bacillus sp. AFS073361]|nr:hypothetical protein COJ96_01970 [Bacillus sp. AFS073361]
MEGFFIVGHSKIMPINDCFFIFYFSFIYFWILNMVNYVGSSMLYHAGSIVFYGRPPRQNIANIDCSVLGFYGGEDQNITNLIPDFEEEMKKHEKSFEAIVYPYAQHAFYNDTNPTYHPKYARDAFARTLTFLNRVTNT